MHGLVKRAIQDLVIKNADAGAWERIKLGAGLDADTFLSMETYPDEVFLVTIV